MSIDFFQARFAFVNTDDGTLTPEAFRVLRTWFKQIGGANGLSSEAIAALVQDIAVSGAFATPPLTTAQTDAGMFDDIGESAQLMALRSEVADLRAEISMLKPAVDLAQQLEEIRILLGMQDARPGIAKGIASGSRGANAALASLLTALANSGLITDSTTV